MASEQFGKFYDDNLRPIYQMPSADGKETVKVTIRQARKHGLMLSVSRILEEVADFDLVKWGKDQVAKACAEYPYDKPDKSEENMAAYLALVKAKADEYRNFTADRGKELHAAVERYYRGEQVDRSDPAVDAAIAAFDEKFAEWGAESITNERAIGGRKFGVVGTPDLVVKCGDVLRIVDFKTTDLSKFTKPYVKWKLQLGAYDWLSGEVKGTEIWQAVGDRTTGDVRFLQHDDPDQWRQAFKHLVEFVFLINSYDPRKA